MAFRPVKCLFALTLGLCAAAIPGKDAFAASGARLVEKGNRAYADGKFDEALEAYEKASVEVPESARIYFNKGAAQFRKGKFGEAAELFDRAALKSKDLALEARSRYNQGNCQFRESERQRDSDLQKSLGALRKAVERYQQALKLDPSLKDAAHNIEVTRLVMKQILDEIKKREEEARKKQEKQKRQAERLQDILKRLEELAAQTEALEAEDKKKGESPEIRKRGDALAEKQKKLRADTEKLAGEMVPKGQQPDPRAAKAAEHLKNAATHQEAAARNLSLPSLPEAWKAQGKAIEEIRKALESMKGKDADSGQQKKKPAGSQEKPQPKPDERGKKPQPTQPPRDETARGILDQEKDDRQRRMIGRPGGYKPVDKDW